MSRRIAYVEDIDAVREKYTQALRDEGFDVTAYASRQDAMDALQQQLPDLALLDVSQAGDRDAGYQLCAEIRRMSGVIPIIFLTSRQSEVDKISGFRLGADDYISKDASIEYLVVRIEALLRRVEAIRDTVPEQGSQPDTPRRSLELDEKYSIVHWRGRHIDMPLTQFWILKEMSHNPGKVRSHRELMKAASLMVEPNTIAAHVKSIRRAFTAEDPAFHCIRTERGRGYRWVEEAS
jgi:two-component system OmpR family response regulator